METPLTIILSGHVCRPQSADMRPFWLGFIELQNKLPVRSEIKNILIHSWNPEMSDLVDLVYSPRTSHHEKQTCYYPEFIQDITPPDLFERNIDRLNSTWKNVSVQSVLGNARSRARAVTLMDSLPPEEARGQVLITRWDLGQTGEAQVNRLVIDASLPSEYLYFSYFSEIDEGYADMWIIAPWHLARSFRSQDTFMLDCLIGRNDYLDKFTRNGWPLSRRKTHFEKIKSHPIGQRIYSLVLKSIYNVQKKSRRFPLVQRIVRKLSARLQLFLERPPMTAENSYVPGDTKVHSACIFPDYQALNIHAMLKFFVLNEGMREDTRFLVHEDFEISPQSGQLIQPQACTIFLWADDVTDGEAIKSLREKNLLPIAAIYLMNETKVTEISWDEQGKTSQRSVRPTSNMECDRLICALDMAVGQTWSSLPLMILPSISSYENCTDWSYLNALLKYIVWSNTGYVGLDNKKGGRPTSDFPDIELVRGKNAFSLRKVAGTIAGIRPYLKHTSTSLDELAVNAERMALEFPSVSVSRRIF